MKKLCCGLVVVFSLKKNWVGVGVVVSHCVDVVVGVCV